MAVVVAGAAVLATWPRAATPTAPADPASQTVPAGVTAPPAASGRGAALPATAAKRPLRGPSVSDPSSPWVVVNKVLPLDPGFRPEMSIVRGYQVATVAAGPLEELLDASGAAGHELKIASAFRSYAYQHQVHEATAATRGREAAERISARPGHSEHQTGLAVDVVTPADLSCSLAACFAQQPAGRWLAANAWRYGFVVRYRPGDTAVTGFEPEPWHLRYVGRRLAAELRRTGTTTLEEYFDLPGGDYRR